MCRRRPSHIRKYTRQIQKLYCSERAYAGQSFIFCQLFPTLTSPKTAKHRRPFTLAYFKLTCPSPANRPHPCVLLLALQPPQFLSTTLDTRCSHQPRTIQAGFSPDVLAPSCLHSLP